MSPRVLPRASLAAFAALFLILFHSPSAAQIPVDYPAVGVTLPGDCQHSPEPWGDDARSFFTELGTYDFWIFPILDWRAADAVRLGVTWPEAWALVESEVCFGTVLAGGIDGPGTGVTLGFPPEHELRAAIRLRIDATTPGRLRLIRDPGTGDFAYRRLDGTWTPFFGGEWPEITASYVLIGPFDRCTGWPLDRPGDFCGLFVRRPSGSIAIQPSIRITAGAVLADTLAADSADCLGIPECIGELPVACLEWIEDDAAWLALEPLDPARGPMRVAMTVDTRGLPPGRYTARVIAGGGCVHCEAVCYELSLDVEPLAVEPATWGFIKARYE